MYRFLSLLSVFFASLTAFAEGIKVAPAGEIPDAVGRAGMVAAVLPANNQRPQELLVVTGGANFPNAKPGAKTPAERGAKVFYDDVAAVDFPTQGAAKLAPVGKMPRPIAYAAFAASPRGLIIAGGCNADGHSAKVTLSTLRDGEWVTESLPDLPKSVAYPAFALVGSRFYVMGGQELPDSTACLNSCYVLDLDNLATGWRELAPMPTERMLAAAGVLDGVIYVMGGCSLHPDAKGEGERTYLKDILCYDPGSNTWAKVPGEMPESLVGVANPLPVHGQSLYVIGGDPGNFYRASLEGKAPAKHPGQAKAIYCFTPASGAWEHVGDLPKGVATFPAVIGNGRILTLSGETFPGVRTPAVYSISPR